MAAPTEHRDKDSSSYTLDRGLPGAYEGETVTRRRFFSGGALAAGGIAGAAVGLPSLGFALGPMLSDTTPQRFQDVGPEGDFTDITYVPKVITLEAGIGQVGKTTIYVRRRNPTLDGPREDQPYIAISTRCTHLGCPVRYVQASQRFICPCHGGVYDFRGAVEGGPPVRPLDRFYTRVRNGQVEVGPRYSVNAEFKRFPSYRDPGQDLDGVGQYLFPGRFSTPKMD